MAIEILESPDLWPGRSYPWRHLNDALRASLAAKVRCVQQLDYRTRKAWLVLRGGDDSMDSVLDQPQRYRRPWSR